MQAAQLRWYLFSIESYEHNILRAVTLKTISLGLGQKASVNSWAQRFKSFLKCVSFL